MAKQRIIPIVYKVDYSQVDKSTASVKKAEQATDKLNKEIKETETVGAKSFGGLKNAILATGVIGVVGTLAKKIFDLGTAQEQTTIAFNTFLGSAEKGKRLLQELTKFSIVTPFSPDQVNKAARALLAFGVEGSKVIPTLKLLGDVSSGTGKDLAEMAVIFGQIRSTGRLMGQDLLQLINAGFNPLQVISQKTGKSVGDLKKEMEKGLISFDMVEQAFIDATSEGGLFFNLMEKQSQSVGGKISTLGGNFEEMGKKIFAANAGPISDFVDLLVKITGFFAQPDAEPPVYISEAQAKLIKETKERIEKFGTLQPSYWDQLVVAVQEYYTTKSRLSREQLELDLAIAKADYDSGIRTAENIKKIRDLSAALGLLPKGTTEDPLPWVKDPKADDINKVTKETKELTKAQKEAREEFMKMMGFTTAAEKVKAKEEEQKKLDKIESDANDRSLKNQDFFNDLKNKKAQEQREYEWKQAEDAANQRIEQEKRLQDEILRLKSELSEALIGYGREVLVDALVGREMDFSDQQAKYEQELELAGDNEEAKKQIKKRQEAERQQFEKAQKEQQKKEAKARIGIDTAVAIIKTFAQFGYPAGLVPAALMAATGVVQAAIVNKYKDGVIDLNGPGTGTSDSIPAMLSRGESVMTAKETDSSMGILKAIRAKKLDDSKLEKLYHKKAGGDGVAFSDKRIVEAIKGQKQPDYTKIGSYLYEVKSRNRDHKSFIRKKYIS